MKKKYFITLCFLSSSLYFSQLPLDLDQDGILNSTDNCILKYNPSQSDEDSDGIGDSCDCSPSFANPNGQQTPDVLIWNVPSNPISTGTLVTFKAEIYNGTPTYQWKKNGNNVGSNSSIYTDNTLVNGDQIICKLINFDPCNSGNIESVSNTISISTSSLAISEIAFKENLIFPVPAKDIIHFKNFKNNTKAEVYDMNGKLITVLKIINESANIAMLKSGLYILKMDGLKTKLIIQ
ncbi:Por secretion system C-terminal sorting domain-containing protein [Chryseobacterium joostei]|nr:Por secretion system C-terminal sorting domain-containing protein [Chryseobacterium joostei]